MSRRDHVITYILMPALIALWAFFLRRYYFCGFVLGDDLEEFALAQFLQTNGLYWKGQLHQRFGVWIPNWLSFRLFGISEASYFLPTWLMSSALPVMGYFLLLKWGYRPLPSLMAAMFAASAPFEVLMGAIHSNDLYLAWFMTLGLLVFFLMNRRPAIQGILLGLLLWVGFYVKLWVVYIFPVLGIHYLIQIGREKQWRGVVAFSSSTLLLHGLTSLVWKIKVGEFLPFISTHAASYPATDLAGTVGRLFLQYPEMIFIRSDLGNNIFGAVPYLLVVFLIWKTAATFLSKNPSDPMRLDPVDLRLLAYYGSFFLLMNFFPNSFKFDQFYSAPRIFRYLTPLSFPMTLHLAKMILDARAFPSAPAPIRFRPYVLGVIFIPLIILNLYQAAVATGPGRTYRQALVAVVKDVKMESPPVLLAEYWMGAFLRDVYFRDDRERISMPFMVQLDNALKYENWLRENQDGLPAGTMMISGLGSYVHYGAHYDGFRLTQFKEPLNPGWELFKEYGTLDYLPKPEPARLWRWTGKAAPAAVQKTEKKTEPKSNDADELFKEGMELFDGNDCTTAKSYFKKIIDRFPDQHQAADAQYFTAICHFREGDWKGTLSEFEKLVGSYPQSVWVAGAHYHMGLSSRSMGNAERARREFETVIDRFPNDAPLQALAREQLGLLPPQGARDGFWKRLKGWWGGAAEK